MGIPPPPLVCFFHPFLLDWSPLTSALSGRDEEIFPRQVCGKRNQGLTSKRAGGPWGQVDAPLAEASSRDDDTDRAVSPSLCWEGGRDVTGVLISLFNFHFLHTIPHNFPNYLYYTLSARRRNQRLNFL